MSDSVSNITVQNRAQAQILHSINSTSNLLARSLADVERRANAAQADLINGKYMTGGWSSMQNTMEYQIRLQTLLEVAGSVGLEQADVAEALALDYVSIDFAEKD